MRRREPAGRLETHTASRNHAHGRARGRNLVRRRNNRRDTGLKPPGSTRCHAFTDSLMRAMRPASGTHEAAVSHRLRVPSISRSTTSALHKDRRCPQEIPVGCRPRAACSCAHAVGRRYSSVAVAIGATAIAIASVQGQPVVSPSALPPAATRTPAVGASLTQHAPGATGRDANS